MASRNSRKTYLEGGYYHLYKETFLARSLVFPFKLAYNRGVEKRIIFKDSQDYSVFLKYLSQYLLPKDERALLFELTDSTLNWQAKDKIRRLLRLNNFYERITLLAFCLMPNHFHFFIKQKDAMDIDSFMNSIFTRYVGYFNKKYNRVGHLFQDEYKAVLITNESQFIYLSKYIHHQALFDSQGHPLKICHPSSYSDYLGETPTPWMHPEEVLEYFAKNDFSDDYQRFVEDQDIAGMEEFMDV